MANSPKKSVAKKTTNKVPKALMEEESEKTSVGKTFHSTKDNITVHDKFNSTIMILALVSAIVLLIVVSPIGFSPNSQNPDELNLPHIKAYFEDSDFNVGDELVMYVEANNFVNLVGFQFDLSFDSDVLRYKKTEYLDMLSPNSPEEKICVNPRDKGSQVTSFVCFKFPKSPGVIEGVSGSGDLAKIVFEIVGRGDVLLQMNDVKLLNSNKEHLESQVFLPELVIK